MLWCLCSPWDQELFEEGNKNIMRDLGQIPAGTAVFFSSTPKLKIPPGRPSPNPGGVGGRGAGRFLQRPRVSWSPLRPLLSKCAQRRQLSLALISLWGPSPECVSLHFPTSEVCIPGWSDAAGILSSVRWVFKTLTVFIPLHLGRSLWVLKCPRWKVLPVCPRECFPRSFI